MYTQIVFTDVVGYSQRPSWAQRDIVIHFGGIVNQCLSSLGLLTDFAPILLPTGDGMVIVLTGELNVGSHLNLANLVTNYWTHFYAAFTSNCTGLTKSNDE